MFVFILQLWMMKGQIHEELNHLDNAREAYKQGVSEYGYLQGGSRDVLTSS